MTKQEEIRKGIAKRLYAEHYSISKEDTFETTYKRYQVECLDMADVALSYLHSQGGVMKVDKGLPENVVQEFSPEYDNGYHRGEMDMLKAGYVATEPLIKENPDGK